MLSTSIGTELDNDENEMKNLKLIMLKKKNLLFWNNQNLTKLNNIKLLFPQRKGKNDKDGASITSTKTVDIVDK